MPINFNIQRAGGLGVILWAAKTKMENPEKGNDIMLEISFLKRPKTHCQARPSGEPS
jgi:hypothetical protein